MSIDKKTKNLGMIVGISAIALMSINISPAVAQGLVCPQPLVYGTYTIFCGAASTAKITPNGVRSVTGCASPQGGPFSNALCITSQVFPYKVIQISVPANGVLTKISGTQTMAISAFNLVTDLHGPIYTTTAPIFTANIGATLNIGISPLNGNYQGSFTVNAVFQ